MTPPDSGRRPDCRSQCVIDLRASRVLPLLTPGAALCFHRNISVHYSPLAIMIYTIPVFGRLAKSLVSSCNKSVCVCE